MSATPTAFWYINVEAFINVYSYKSHPEQLWRENCHQMSGNCFNLLNFMNLHQLIVGATCLVNVMLKIKQIVCSTDNEQTLLISCYWIRAIITFTYRYTKQFCWYPFLTMTVAVTINISVIKMFFFFIHLCSLQAKKKSSKQFYKPYFTVYQILDSLET